MLLWRKEDQLMQDTKQLPQVSKLVLVLRSMDRGVAWLAFRTGTNESGQRIKQEMVVATRNLLQAVS